MQSAILRCISLGKQEKKSEESKDFISQERTRSRARRVKCVTESANNTALEIWGKCEKIKDLNSKV